jgi:hypothetical protein
MKSTIFNVCLSQIPSESGRGRHITPANQGLVRLFPWSKGGAGKSSLRLADRMVMSY